MRLKSLFLLLCLVFSTSAFANRYTDSEVDSLRARVDSLERQLSRLESRVDMIQNQPVAPPPYHPETDCSPREFVRLLKNNNIVYPVAERLCPFRCTRMMEEYRRNDPQSRYTCVR